MAAITRFVKQTWFFDVQASYSFTFAATAETPLIAGYGKNMQHLAVAGDSKPEESAGAQTANFAFTSLEAVAQQHHYHDRPQ